MSSLSGLLYKLDQNASASSSLALLVTWVKEKKALRWDLNAVEKFCVKFFFVVKQD